MSISSIEYRAFPTSSIFHPVINCRGRRMNDLIDEHGAAVLNLEFQSSEELGTHGPLYYALLHGFNFEVIERLINLGASVDQVDSMQGGTALHAYMKKLKKSPPDYNILRLLLAHTQDINKVDAAGITPLHAALTIDELNTNEPDWEVIKLLLKHGADPEATTQEGKTPLDILDKMTVYAAEGSVWKERARKLIKKYAVTPTSGPSLAKAREELAAKVQTVKESLKGNDSIPNPRVLRLITNLDRRDKITSKAAALLQKHKDLCRDLADELRPYFYQWNRSKYGAFSDFFDPASFFSLQALCEGNKQMINMLGARKESHAPAVSSSCEQGDLQIPL